MSTNDIPDGVEIPDGYELGETEDGVIDETDTDYVTVTDPEKEKAYWFEFRELTWSEVQDLVSDNMELKDGSPRLDTTAYQRDALHEKTVDSNVNSATFFAGMKQSLGKQLEQHVPDPLSVEELEDLEELGN